MADKIYGLYPYSWQPPIKGRPGYHYRHAGVIGGFDWRPLPAQGTAGPTNSYGFFAFAPGTAPSDLVTLGVGDCREIVATPTMRTELRIKLGLSRDPSGATLVDLIADICGPLSVPDGSTGVKTFMPTRLNEFDLHLAGHSKVFSRRINAAELLSNNPAGHANKIRDVLRKRYDATFAEFGLEVTRRVLGEELRRHGYSRSELAAGAPGKASEWRRLLSPSLANRQGMRPADPATTHTETWPNIAADISVTAQDQTWETMVSSPYVSGLTRAVSGNKCQPVSKGSLTGAMCLSAVSSVDHSTSGAIATLAAACDALAFARLRTAATTCYAAGIYRSALDEGAGRHLFKWVSSVRTSLAYDAGYAGTAAGSTIICEADGSTITGSCTGESDQTASDSAISDGVRGGISLVADTAQANAQFGTITIADNQVAPVAAWARCSNTIIQPLVTA